MTRTLSRLFAVVLVLAMLAGMSAAAQAQTLSWGQSWTQHKDSGKDSGHDNDKHFSNMFGDISLEDYPWAFKHIEKMATKGFIKGLGNGRFNGNAEITHQEAVIMIVRYMGLEKDALAAMNATLPFSDAKQIAPWARGYVKVALDKNLLWVPDAGQMTALSPNSPTKRVEAVVMLVKAAGLEAEAKAKMTQPLTFKDAASIPSAYVGYVAVGVEKQLVKGYDDNTFQPFKAVKRAEMATFLGRTDETFPRHGDDNEVEGKFVSATATTITIESKGLQGTFTLAATCPVYIDDTLAQLTDLKAGDKVELELDSQDKVVFVDAEREDDDEDETPVGTLTGTVKSVSLGTGVPSTMVVTLASNAGEKTFTIATNCVIKVDGVVATAADIRIGDNVTLTLVSGTGDQLAQILITRTQITAVAGVVKGLTVATGTPSTITILPDNQTANVTYTIAGNCVVKVNGTVTTLTQAQIQVNERIELKVSGTGTAAQVTEMNVVRTQTSTVAGTVQSILLNTTGSSVITVLPNGQTANVSYLLASNVVVKYNNAVVPATEIKVGDKVTMTLTNATLPTVSEIVIGSRETTVSGAISAINYDSRTLTLTKDGVATTYTVSATAVVTLLNQAFTWNQVALNDTVTLTVVDNVVTKINVTVHNGAYTGTVQSVTVDATGNHFVLTVGTVNYTVDVPSTAVITHAGAAGTFADVTIGSTVTVNGAYNGTKIVAAQIAVQ